MSVEPPSIPRMPPTQWQFLWGAILINVLRMVLVDAVGPVVDWIWMGGFAAVLLYAGCRLLWGRWQLRRAIRVLRRLTPVNRAALLEDLEDTGARAYFEYQLMEHGAASDEGVVEHFAFSPVDRREIAALTWGLAVLGLLIPTMASSLRLDLRWIMAALAGAIALGVAVTVLIRVRADMSRRFAVSSFGLLETLPDGSVRRLMWGNGIVIVNRPWLRRIELSVDGNPERVHIPYNVVGFDRLVEAILEKGHFVREEAAAATPL
jgi:hypothetical protein